MSEQKSPAENIPPCPKCGGRMFFWKARNVIQCDNSACALERPLGWRGDKPAPVADGKERKGGLERCVLNNSARTVATLGDIRAALNARYAERDEAMEQLAAEREAHAKTREERDSLAKFKTYWFEPVPYVAVNLKTLLDAVPEANTGDWYGQLHNWCDEVMPQHPSCSPNVTVGDLQARIRAASADEARKQLAAERSLREKAEALLYTYLDPSSGADQGRIERRKAARAEWEVAKASTP